MSLLSEISCLVHHYRVIHFTNVSALYNCTNIRIKVHICILREMWIFQRMISTFLNQEKTLKIYLLITSFGGELTSPFLVLNLRKFTTVLFLHHNNLGMKYNITVERIATSAWSFVPPEFIEVRTVRPLRGCVGRKLFCMITGGFELKFTVLNSASYKKT